MGGSSSPAQGQPSRFGAIFDLSHEEAHPSPLEWERVEMLSDLLAENADLKTALASALQIITEIYQRSGGILLVQSASDPVPILIISHQVPESLAGQLGDEESPLRRLCQQVRLLQAPA